MKEIRAYVQPFVLPLLAQALEKIPAFPGLTVSDCEGFGKQKVLPSQDFTPFIAKKRLEIFAPDALVDIIFSTIMKYAHSGRPGDGKVYVIDVAEGGRIRTGERGADSV